MRRIFFGLLVVCGVSSVLIWGLPRLYQQVSGVRDRGPGAVDRRPDLDRDGYEAWNRARDPSMADCDDSDPAVNPTTERYIPAGEFWRGHPGMADARPASRVFVSGFCMDLHEVANGQFARFLATLEPGKAQAMYDFEDRDDDVPLRIRAIRGGFKVTTGYELHPVVEVTPKGARAYCRSHGKRLPTEAEWEKGARGPADRRAYPWGDQAPTCSLANYSRIQYLKRPKPLKIEHCVGDTRPVGSYPGGRSPYGLFDMAGNVAEFVSDFYQAGYYAQASSRRDPRGPARGFARDEVNPHGIEALVTRGGGWAGDETMILVHDRHPDPLDVTSNAVGFRCARSVK